MAMSHTGAGVPAHRAAIRELLAALVAREPQACPLEDALGLPLANDLVAPMSLPPFDNSQMDGFAVRAAEFAGDPREFALAATVPAGAVPGPLEPRHAAPIMTGAMLPE